MTSQGHPSPENSLPQTRSSAAAPPPSVPTPASRLLTEKPLKCLTPFLTPLSDPPCLLCLRNTACVLSLSPPSRPREPSHFLPSSAPVSSLLSQFCLCSSKFCFQSGISEPPKGLPSSHRSAGHPRPYHDPQGPLRSAHPSNTLTSFPALAMRVHSTLCRAFLPPGLVSAFTLSIFSA